MLKAGLFVSLFLLTSLAPAAAQTYSGVCEDLFMPGYPHPEALGTPLADFHLIPRDLFSKARADCEKRGKGFLADDKVRMALVRLRALTGDVTTVPDLRKAADKGASEASFLIYTIYDTMKPASPAAEDYKLLPRELAERELRRAAKDGNLVAMSILARGLILGAVTGRDLKEARVWLDKALDLSRRRNLPMERSMAALDLAVLIQDDPQSSAADRAMLPELAHIVEAMPQGQPYAQWLMLRGQRLGVGWAQSDAEISRLTASGDIGKLAPVVQSEVLLELARQGAPGNDKLALLLEAAKPQRSWSFDKVVGGMLADGKPVGRDLVRAFPFFVTAAGRSHAEAIDFARRAVAVGHGVKVPPEVLRRLYEAVDLDVPGATDAAIRLLDSSASDAHDTLGASLLTIRYARKRPEVQIYLLERAAAFGPQPEYAPFDTKDRAAAALDKLAESSPVAMRAKAVALGKGSLYRQDAVAAAELLTKAAEAGDAEAMRLLADAYSDGDGVAEDRAAELRWTKAAAKAGLPDAQRDLVREIPFRGPADDFSLHDAIVTAMMLYGDSEAVASLSIGVESAFSSIAVDRWGKDYVAAALMDGFRASMALRDDEKMVRLFKDAPKEVTLAVEGVLKRDDFLTSAPDGFMRPEARTALAAWARAQGVPAMEADAPRPEPAADARLSGVAAVPDERIASIRERTFSLLKDAKGDKAQKEAIDRLALLAEYGDLAARAEIVKSYSSSKALKQKVVMGLAFLYGLDVLISAAPDDRSNTMDFTFMATDIAAYGASNVEADVLLITLRDDARLRDFSTFNRIADNFIFIGGLCDALAERAKANEIPGMEADACSAASRRALLAWAEKRGPDGSEAQVRRQAAEALNKLSP